MQPLLDISRLLSSAGRASLSGLDRVELAYVRHCATLPPRDRCFVALSPYGHFSLLPDALAMALLEAWLGVTRGEAVRARLRGISLAARAWLLSGLGHPALLRRIARMPRAALLLTAHQSMSEAAPIAALKRRGARFVPIIHDLIPLTHPEYARPRQTRAHARRLAVASALADAVLVVSGATRVELVGHFAGGGGEVPPVLVAPLGFDLPPLRSIPNTPPPEHPYFVTLGTIEPRKNHLLLLHLWRHLAETMPARDVPRLVIVGRRGWENEQVVDMLERCPALQGHVEEINGCSDQRMASLLASARALLMPSFAEGFGMPVAEALSLGVPVICSDLAALREVGGNTPDYLDPLDGPGWKAMILDHARPGPAHAAQRARLGQWHKPLWNEHMDIVEKAIAGLRQPTA